MGKLIKIIIVGAVSIYIYGIFSDPVKKERIYNIVESSTGINLNNGFSTVDSIMRKSLKTIKNPEFQESIKEMGNETIEKLKDNKENTEKYFYYNQVSEEYFAENINL